MADNGRFRFCAVFVALVTLAVFGRVITCDFINFDDIEYVTDNPVVQKGLTTEGIEWAFARLHGKATYWHPLTWMSHMVDCQLFGLNPTMHHLTNLLLHTANAVLLFLVFVQMTGRLWPSAAVALLFAVHPLQVDTVAWVTERKNLLTVTFVLLSIGAYTRYVRQRQWRWYICAVFSFALGLMCKPALVALPAILLLLDYWPLKRIFAGIVANEHGGNSTSGLKGGRGGMSKTAQLGPSSTSAWKLLAEKLPFFALAIGSSAITILAHRGLGMLSREMVPLSARIANAIVSYGRYLKKFVFPRDLIIHYPHPGYWPADYIFFTAAILVAISAFAFAQWRQRPWLLTGWLWFLGSLVPAIGIIQVGPQAMAERFVYFPIIGLGIAIAWTAAALWEKRGLNRGSGFMAGAALCVVLSALTIRQIGFWRNSITLWEHAIAVNSHNYVAHNNLSDALLQVKQIDRALDEAQTAATIAPTSPEPWCQLGNVYKAKENWPAAITHYKRAAQLLPEWLDMPLLLAQAYEAVGNIKGAIEQYNRALTIDSNSTVALNNLAWILTTTEKPALRDSAKAVQLAKRACEITRNSVPQFIGTLAAAYAANGQFDAAVRTAGQAVEAARAVGDQALAERNLQLQQLYAQHKPYSPQ